MKASMGLAAAAAALCLAVPNAAVAAATPWVPPTNVKLVQATNSATTNVYTTIQLALAAIPVQGSLVPSPTNPYVIRVGPGSFDVGAGLALRPYVSLEGAGPDQTIVNSTASSTTVAEGACPVGAITVPASSSVSNLKIVNRLASSNLAVQTAALVFTGAQGSASRVNVVAGAVGVAVSYTMGVCISGYTTDVKLDAVSVEARNATGADTSSSGQCNAVTLLGGNLTVRNSQLASWNTGNGWSEPFNVNTDYSRPGTVVVTDSELVSNGPNIYGLMAGGDFVTVRNTTITLGNGTDAINYACALYASTSLTVTGSRVITGFPGVEYYFEPGSTSIAGSQLPGAAAFLAGARLVGNYDGAFQPIANQP